MTAFHEVLFPLDIALGASGGPERRTEIVAVGSGREERNARWAHARRAVVAFFEERRGRLHGFRWRDRLDDRTSTPGSPVTPLDQGLGAGTGTQTTFQLVRTYGGAFAPYQRPIAKPVAGSVRVAVAGTERTAGTHFTVNAATGLITFQPGHVPAAGQAVTAGFLFDVPVRFDTDFLEVDLSAFAAGSIPRIPLVEIVP
jgi:uncharacterized protein (TIGR02217 family)